MRRAPAALLALSTAFAIVAAGAAGARADDPAATPTPTQTQTQTSTPTATAPAAPVAYHVDCSARSDGDGSAQHPWNRLADVNAHGAFLPAQSILLKRGTTCRGRLTPAGSGSAGHPITLGAYGSGPKPTVAGGGTRNWTGAVQLTDQQYWTVRDIRITNHAATSTTTYRSGLYLLDQSGRLRGITVHGVTVEDVVSDPATTKTAGARAFGGITAITSPHVRGVGFDGLTIEGNTVDHVGRSGIISLNLAYQVGRGHDLHVRMTGNRVSHTRGDGIVEAGVYAGRIDHNVAHHTGEIFPCAQCHNVRGPDTADAAIWTAFSNGVRIDHNEAYATSIGGGDGEGFDADIHTRHTVIEDDYSHDNLGGGVLLCASTDATVRFNVIQNNRRGQIVFTCGKSHTVRIENNDVYLRGDSLTTRVIDDIKGAGSTGVSFTNNLVWAWGTAKYEWPGAVHAASNTFVGSHHRTEPHGPGTSRTAPAVRHPGAGGTGWGTLDAYRLKSGHAVQRGVAIPKSVTVDILGHRVSSSHPARGAFSS